MTNPIATILSWLALRVGGGRYVGPFAVLAAVLAIGAAAYGVSRTASAEAAQVEHGKYLVRFGGCTDCHTPGHLLGKPDMSRFLGGSDMGLEVPGLGIFVAPNLTPDRVTGLGIGPRTRSRPPFKRELGLTAASSRPSCHGAHMPG